MPRYIDAEKLKEHKFVGVRFERYFRIVSDGRVKTDDEIYAYKVGYNEAIDNIADFEPTADVVERKSGKWIEKEVMSVDEGKAIDEWQSCRCSVCGRYDTRPYMYYFDEPHFCSWCGAEMEKA